MDSLRVEWDLTRLSRRPLDFESGCRDLRREICFGRDFHASGVRSTNRRTGGTEAPMPSIAESPFAAQNFYCTQEKSDASGRYCPWIRRKSLRLGAIIPCQHGKCWKFMFDLCPTILIGPSEMKSLRRRLT